MMDLFGFLNKLSVQLTEDQTYLEIDYRPMHGAALYDICDVNGRIIKTGKYKGKSMRIAVNDLLSSAYVFLILDGDQIRSKRFTIER
ncbi:MAG: hypothetical protein RL226_152 [Bacteroidota bacterium]